MRLSGYVEPYKAPCCAVTGWFWMSVIGAFRSSLFRWVVLSAVCFFAALLLSFLDRRYPRFWNFNSTITVDVVRVKSYVNRLFDSGLKMLLSACGLWQHLRLRSQFFAMQSSQPANNINIFAEATVFIMFKCFLQHAGFWKLGNITRIFPSIQSHDAFKPITSEQKCRWLCCPPLQGHLYYLFTAFLESIPTR